MKALPKPFLIPGVIMMLSAFNANSQATQKEVSKLWWDINESCFAGTSITKFNGLFMSTASRLRASSVLLLKKDLVTKITDKQLIFSHETMSKLPGFPAIKDSLSADPPCEFTLDYTSSATLEVYGKLVDEANIGSINAELQSILKSAKTLKPKITRWGIDYLELGEVRFFLTEQLAKKNKYVMQITDGKHYLASFGVWVEGLTFSYEMNKETVNKIRVIYESNKDKFIEAGVKMDFSSETAFSTSMSFKKRFYPFLKFIRITKSGTIKLMGNKTDVEMVEFEDADMSEFQD
jgi:hypothetical protein